MRKVMIVDDDSMVYHIVKKTIPWEEYRMEVTAYAPNGMKAIEYLAENKIDVLFVDLSMPHMGGMEFIRRVYEYLPETVFVILSSHSEYRFVKESFCIGAFDYLLKVDIDDEAIISELLNRVTDKLEKMKKEGERHFDLGDLISKLNFSPQDGEKDEYWYCVQTLHLQPEANRLKIAEILLKQSEANNMVYGCYEGHFVILYYTRDKKAAEKLMPSIYESVIKQALGIIASGKSCWGFYRDIEELYLESVRNIDDGFFRIKEYLMENYSNQELSLQMVADALNMNRRSVSKYVSDYSGLMFKAYLNEIRIQTAKEKLSKTNMRIQEVAYASGYTNVEHFTRIFTEKAGCSPSQYAASRKNQNELLL